MKCAGNWFGLKCWLKLCAFTHNWWGPIGGHCIRSGCEHQVLLHGRDK